MKVTWTIKQDVHRNLKLSHVEVHVFAPTPKLAELLHDAIKDVLIETGEAWEEKVPE